jgi:hypothetical protein
VIAMRAITILVSLFALGIGACGRRASPVAPELRLPAVVSQLDAVVRAGGIELAWTIPKRRVDNTPLRDLTLIHVFRAEDAGGGDTKPALMRRGRIVGYTEIATIRIGAPAPAVLAGDRVTVLDAEGLTTGRRYTYVVLTEDSQGRLSPPSNRLSVPFLAAPEAPSNLTAQPGETEARLAWTRPARLVDGTPAPSDLAYEVLRAPGPDAALAPLAGDPVRETRLVDRGLENERAYDYAVRAVRVEGGTKLVSEPTARVRVTPVDMTPPSPPADLVAIPSERTVRLSWKPSPEADVARYVVYRAATGAGFTRVGSVSPPGTTFVDREVPAGRWRYVVSAEDTSSRRNESRRSNEVTVSVP